MSEWKLSKILPTFLEPMLEARLLEIPKCLHKYVVSVHIILIDLCQKVSKRRRAINCRQALDFEACWQACKFAGSKPAEVLLDFAEVLLKFCCSFAGF